jgi:hypothetical protein
MQNPQHASNASAITLSEIYIPFESDTKTFDAQNKNYEIILDIPKNGYDHPKYTIIQNYNPNGDSIEVDDKITRHLFTLPRGEVALAYNIGEIEGEKDTKYIVFAGTNGATDQATIGRSITGGGDLDGSAVSLTLLQPHDAPLVTQPDRETVNLSNYSNTSAINVSGADTTLVLNPSDKLPDIFKVVGFNAGNGLNDGDDLVINGSMKRKLMTISTGEVALEYRDSNNRAKYIVFAGTNGTTDQAIIGHSITGGVDLSEGQDTQTDDNMIASLQAQEVIATTLNNKNIVASTSADSLDSQTQLLKQAITSFADIGAEAEANTTTHNNNYDSDKIITATDLG